MCVCACASACVRVLAQPLQLSQLRFPSPLRSPLHGLPYPQRLGFRDSLVRPLLLPLLRSISGFRTVAEDEMLRNFLWVPLTAHAKELGQGAVHNSSNVRAFVLACGLIVLKASSYSPYTGWNSGHHRDTKTLFCVNTALRQGANIDV